MFKFTVLQLCNNPCKQLHTMKAWNCLTKITSRTIWKVYYFTTGGARFSTNSLTSDSWGARTFSISIKCKVLSWQFSHYTRNTLHEKSHFYQLTVIINQLNRLLSGDKRYQCSLCGRRFIQSNHLKTHLRRMHHIDDSLPSIRTMHKVQKVFITPKGRGGGRGLHF